MGKKCVIQKPHEVWLFLQQPGELFKDYMNKFLKIKQKASGYPNNCTTKERSTKNEKDSAWIQAESSLIQGCVHGQN